MVDLSVDSVDKEGLQSLYQKDRAAKAVFDHLASRERNWSETTVDRLAHNVWNAGSDASRAEIIAVLRKLEATGCGTFIVGRGGYPSRFQWHVGMVEVGRYAAGQPAVIEEVDPEAPTDEQEEESLTSTQNGRREPAIREITHAFQLRPDLLVSFKLPADLTTTEAARLADFLKTLPF